MNKTTPRKVDNQVSKGRKVAYGFGAVAENAMQNAAGNMANPFFNVGLNVAPSLLGIAAMMFRIWDAITDPLMGWISDRTELRMGRRRPYIIGGAIAGGLLFALLWWCPLGMSPTFYFIWYLGISILFYTAFTVFGVPYVALGYELSPDYHERTRIMSFRTWFQSVAGICIQWLFWLTQRPVFDGTVDGMRWVGIGMGILIILMGITPGIFLKERQLTTEEIVTNREKVKLRNALSVLRVRPFRIILYTLVMAMAGMFTVIILGFYINVYYLFGGDLVGASTIIGVQGTFYHLSCMASLPLISWTSTRIGKKSALILFLAIAVVGTLSKWVLFTPVNPWLQLIVVALMAPGLSAMWTLLASMTADVTDVDELDNGTRREGSFGALYGWSMKLGFALCFFVAGFVLEWTGFDAELGENQPVHTIFWIRILYSLIPALGLLGAILCIWRYPITEKSANDVRRELDKRSIKLEHKE